MNIKILTALTIFGLLTVTMPAIATENFMINYDVLTTGFSVTITAAVNGVPETQMNFSGIIGPTISPKGTNNGANRWGYITNTGSGGVPISFSLNLDDPNLAGISLLIASNSGMTDICTTIPCTPSGWTNIAEGGSADIFTKATFSAGAVDATNIATIDYST